MTRKMGLFMVISAFFFQAAGWGLQVYRAYRETPVSAAAIHPQAIAICPHHEHGCPKDCLCPKTYVALAEPPQAGTPAGAIREPSLVACTEHGPGALTPDAEFFLPQTAMAFVLTETISRLAHAAPESLREPHLPPLRKIPIA